MKRKPLITLLLSVLLVAVVLVGGTLAYLVAEGDLVINSFALAEVDTEIIEDPSGDAADKAPYVVNNGASTVFVRARAVVVTRDDSAAPVTADDMNINYNTTDWTLNGDWYYYNDPLAQGDQTEPLFVGVTDIDVEDGALFDIYVYHESVLAKGTANGPDAFNVTAG